MRATPRIPREKGPGLLYGDLQETASFILRHPLNDRLAGKAGTCWRYLSWQIRSRLRPDPSRIDFAGRTKLVVKRGVAQRRICYMPLHEFEEMAFVVHALRAGDLFLDVGANIGAYTVLAGAVSGAAVIACEPLPASYALLRRNLSLNRAGGRVVALNVGVGGKEGTLAFTSSFGPKDHVVTEPEAQDGARTLALPVRTLDAIVGGRDPTLLKIDVEGYETEVLRGGETVFRNDSLRAIVIELKGHGARYGYDESLLMDRIAGLGFRPFRYDPFDRRIFSSDAACTPSGNRIYLRNPDWVRQRVADHPGFPCGNRSI